MQKMEEQRFPTKYENYSVSREGNVYSDRRNKKLAATTIGGYKYVTIPIDKKTTSKSVHRLVATTFLPNPENLPTVNHKDGDGFNNHVDNLEWAGHKQQMKHALNNNLVTLTKRGGMSIFYGLWLY